MLQPACNGFVKGGDEYALRSETSKGWCNDRKNVAPYTERL
jgi:hypothetical protein